MGLEIWKPVPNYENRYMISNFGNILSLHNNKQMTSSETKDGYLRVRLFNGEIYTSKMIHRLVAEAFIEYPDDGQIYEVDHINNNVKNNNLNNLRWITHRDNLEKSFSLNHQRVPKRKVYQFDLNNNLICVYESVCDAFRATKIRHISECALGIRKTAGGYMWSYK